MPGSSICTVTLTTNTYGGEALGRLEDGRAVFVPFALPCEQARVRLVEQKRGYARAELLEVLQPSPERIEPRCVHFGVCGGCHYQHMPYEAQLAAKRAILRDQLERIGRLVDPPVQAAVASPNQFGYRNHVQFHLAADGQLGYHQARSQQALAIQECHLPEPTLAQVWPQLDFEAIPGLERVGLRLGAEDDVQIILEGDELELPSLSVEGLPLSVVHLSPSGALVLAGSETLVMEVLERPFQVSAGAFFQVNTPMAAALVEHILESIPRFVELSADAALVDAYCGVGLFSAFLAPRIGRLIGIEASPAACDDFVANLDEFDNVELYEAEVEDVLPRLEVEPRVILLDPPRAGLAPQAMDGLLSLGAPLLVYVSCDPATLGRDARRLGGGGYELAQVTPFDLFPQTYHVESVSFWISKE
ncbi:MAG: class I SAM-dependent RNA methyltransferase [Anaerolineales bacterium]|nr:class I SAM-dependent RNA methyltransferase [Anaerolineales bacterium]